MSNYCSTDYNKTQLKTIRKTFNILIVDDDVIGAECLKEILELKGHRVNIVDDGSRSITLCQSNKYDVVFMDYHLDGLDGVQLTNILKDDMIKKTIILAYTGDNSSLALELFKNSGMDGIVVKPIDLSIINMLLCQIEEKILNNKSDDMHSFIKKTKKNSVLFF
jgi:CheY-like chemotaxis protein